MTKTPIDEENPVPKHEEWILFNSPLRKLTIRHSNHDNNSYLLTFYHRNEIINYHGQTDFSKWNQLTIPVTATDFKLDQRLEQFILEF